MQTFLIVLMATILEYQSLGLYQAVHVLGHYESLQVKTGRNPTEADVRVLELYESF